MKNRLFALCLALSFFIPRVYAAPPKGYIALTFDDGPAGKITQRLLDGLDRRRVQATFFLCLYRITQYPEPVRRMAAHGHEIGIHGGSHDYFTTLTPTQLQQELAATKAAITMLTGTAPTLLRPPGGLYNKVTEQTAAEERLSIILWNRDPEDWDRQKRQHTVQSVVENAAAGDIVLLHDLSNENVQSALAIVDALHARGFRFCTVSELADRGGAALLPGRVYTAFP